MTTSQSNFHGNQWIKDDDYMTPKSAWENITQYIPKDKVIWEAFMGDGKSGDYLRELGCMEVIHNYNDFFENDEGDIVVSNPPFSQSKEIMTRLKHLDKPFILILPTSKLTTQYTQHLFSNEDGKLQIIIPKNRIHFNKNLEGWKKACYFDCFYYCYKMNLPRDLIWID